MTESLLPRELQLAVARDLRPVRPLPPPWRRSLGLAPAALVTLVALPTYWGWRAKIDVLGPWTSIGLSIFQILVALAVLAAAMRESVPGRNLSARAIVGIVAAVSLVTAAITFFTDSELPIGGPPDVFFRWVWECWFVSVSSALPLFALSCWLVVRALPTRPALAGALGGLGAGVAGDAAMRLFCAVSEPAHVIVSHGGAVLTFAALGALVTTAWDRWASRRRRGFNVSRHDHGQ